MVCKWNISQLTNLYIWISTNAPVDMHKKQGQFLLKKKKKRANFRINQLTTKKMAHTMLDELTVSDLKYWLLEISFNT